MSFDDDLNACAAIVQKADPDRFAAAMASPVDARKALFPLYAMNVEVSRAPWVTQEAMIAEMRLQWWRDALEEIGQLKKVRRHEVLSPLARVLEPELTPTLDALVSARRWDIYKEPFSDRAHFDAYIDNTAGGLMWVAARLLGAEDTQETQSTVRSVGRAAGLARFLQAVPALEDHNRIPLVDGRPEAVAQLAREALENYPERSRIKADVPKSARPALTEAFLARPILAQAAKRPQDVVLGGLGVSPFRRSLMLWRQL